MTDDAVPGGIWASADLHALGLSRLPSLLVARQRWDDLFTISRSRRFLRAQAAEFRQAEPGGPVPNPLQTLDVALAQAIRLGRAPEMAAFTLSRALWTVRLAAQTPLSVLRAGDEARALALAREQPQQLRPLWSMLLAWELSDAGRADRARRVLAEVAGSGPPRLTSPHAGLAVAVLPWLARFDQPGFDELQRCLLDDNDRTDLCRRLIEIGEPSLASRTAAAIRLFPRNRLLIRAEAARSAAAAGDQGGAHSAAQRAEEELRLLAEDDGRAELLAAVAGARVAGGDPTGAGEIFAMALAAAEVSHDPAAALCAIASEQARAGLPAQSELTIARIGDCHELWTGLGALSCAQAAAGQTEQAALTLRRIDFTVYIDGQRVMRDAAAAAAAAGHARAALGWIEALLPSAGRAGPLAAVASSTVQAGDPDLAWQIAESIAEPGWRARALTDVWTVGGVEQRAGAVKSAIDAVTDAQSRAQLLAEFAVTRRGRERRQLISQAFRVAHSAERADRWRALAVVGLAQSGAGDPAAAATFAAARDAAVAAEDDQSYLARNLTELGKEQAEAGDSAGARDTFAAALQEPAPDQERWLKPLTLAAIALRQAEASRAGDAASTCGEAAGFLADVPGEWLPLVTQALAEAQAAAGDTDAAFCSVFTLLEAVAGDDSGWDDEDDDDGEADEAEYRAVTCGVLAGVAVARRLLACQPERAREELAEIAELAGDGLRRDSLAHLDVIAELACAQALAGDGEGAARTAAWEPSGMAVSRVCAALADRQATAGDAPGAVEAASLIQDPAARAATLADIAATLAAGETHQAAREAFGLAVAQSDYQKRPDAVRTLTGIAAAQARAGYSADARQTLEQAARRLPGVGDARHRDQLLCRIAQQQAALGEVQRAAGSARAIHVPALAGEALFAVALAAALPDRDAGQVAAIVETIEHPWWKAAGLTAVAAMKAKSGSPEAEAGFAAAERLMNQIPEGADRSDLQAAMIEILLEAGSHDLAAGLAVRMATDQGQRLAAVADALASRGAVAALRQLLPACARFPEAAYAACHALARAIPDQVSAIITEIVASGENLPSG